MRKILIVSLLFLSSCCSPRALSGVSLSVASLPTPLFMGEVTADSVDALIAEIQARVAAKDKEIDITIDSPGGSVMDGWRLSRAIEAAEDAGVPVICTVDGMAASMAFYELQSCTVRVMKKRSLLMAHGPAMASLGGKAQTLEEEAAFLRALERALANHETAKMKIGVDEFIRRSQKDWWMGYGEALEVGAVDLVE